MLYAAKILAAGALLPVGLAGVVGGTEGAIIALVATVVAALGWTSLGLLRSV